MDSDEEYARRLQEQYDAEAHGGGGSNNSNGSSTPNGNVYVASSVPQVGVASYAPSETTGLSVYEAPKGGTMVDVVPYYPQAAAYGSAPSTGQPVQGTGQPIPSYATGSAMGGSPGLSGSGGDTSYAPTPHSLSQQQAEARFWQSVGGPPRAGASAGQMHTQGNIHMYAPHRGGLPANTVYVDDTLVHQIRARRRSLQVRILCSLGILLNLFTLFLGDLILGSLGVAMSLVGYYGAKRYDRRTTAAYVIWLVVEAILRAMIFLSGTGNVILALCLFLLQLYIAYFVLSFLRLLPVPGMVQVDADDVERRLPV